MNATAEKTQDIAMIDDPLRSFAESFHFTVTDSFYSDAYSDAYIGIHEPDAVTFRLTNNSTQSRHIAKLEQRRKDALAARAPADARLIAAASALLEALRWAERAIAPFSKDPAEKSGMNLIRAAISKAEASL